MDVLQAIALFLGCAVILLVITVIWLLLRYNSLYGDYLDAQSRQMQAQDTNKDLLHERFVYEQTLEALKQRTEKPTVQEIEPDEQPVLTYEAPEPQEYSKSRLPDGHTNTFRCEDWRRLNMPGSLQELLQRECLTDTDTGLRFWYNYKDLNDNEPYICAALGTAYGVDIGDTWRVTLKCGEVFNIILSDFKHPIDNINPFDFGDADRNYDGQPTTSVIEFVFDEKIAPTAMIKAGTMSYFDRFGGLYGDGGDIVKIEYLGRKWEP
jgi:hypothetical protein